jgi:hypothetical protein
VGLSATFEALWSVLDYLRILHSRAAVPAQRAWLENILSRCDGGSLHECYRLISESIDVDMTKAMKQTCIREGYSEVGDHQLQKHFIFTSLLSDAILDCKCAFQKLINQTHHIVFKHFLLYFLRNLITFERNGMMSREFW